MKTVILFFGILFSVHAVANEPFEFLGEFESSETPTEKSISADIGGMNFDFIKDKSGHRFRGKELCVRNYAAQDLNSRFCGVENFSDGAKSLAAKTSYVHVLSPKARIETSLYAGGHNAVMAVFTVDL